MSQKTLFQQKSIGYEWINYTCLLGSRAILYFWVQKIIHCFPRTECITFTMPLSLLAWGSRNGSWELVSSWLTYRKCTASTAMYRIVPSAGSAVTVFAVNKPETLNPQNLSSTGDYFRLSFWTKVAAKHLSLSSAFCTLPKMEAMKQKTCGLNVYERRASFQSFHLLQKKVYGPWCFVTVLLPLTESYLQKHLFTPLWHRKTALGWVWVLITASLRSLNSIRIA